MTDSIPRSRITRRLDVPDLKAKLELLFQKGRNPRISTVASLDRELGLPEERSFRQYYRGDRPSGIPGEYVDIFLDLFALEENQLLLSLEAFRLEIEGKPQNTPVGEGWYSTPAAWLEPTVLMSNPGDIRLAWDEIGVTIDLVSESTTVPIAAVMPSLLNLRRRNSNAIYLRFQSEFRIEVSLRENHCHRLLGLIEGSQISCFHKPFLLQPGPVKIVIPLDGEPFYIDELGRHSVWIFLMEDIRFTAGEVNALDSEDPRKRRAAAERIYTISRAQQVQPPVLLRADFNVIA